MTIALCLGGAASIRDDWTAALDLGAFDFVVACNDAMTVWPGRLDVVVTLHPEKLQGWRDQRRANGYPDAARYLVHGDSPPEWTELAEFRFPGQNDSGSSGLFAAKVALIDLGADRAVLAGIPLTREPHFFDTRQWEAAVGYRAVWDALRPEYCARIRSMSGWTSHFLGLPTAEWIAGGSRNADALAPRIEDTRVSKVIIDKIIYEPHPVTPERKRELKQQGYRIIDAVFAPQGEIYRVGPDDSAGPDAVPAPSIVPSDWRSQHWAKQVHIAEALIDGALETNEGETRADAARRVIGEHLAVRGV